MSVNNIGAKVLNLRIQNKTSQDTLAHFLEIDRTSLSRLEHGKRKVDASELDKIATFFNVSTDFLLGHLNINSSHNLQKADFNDLINIPIIGTIKAGINGLANLDYDGYDTVVAADIDPTNNYFWLRIIGDSMIGDGILDGDLALIQQTPTFNNGDICAIVINGDEGTLKHISRKHQSIVLTASNPSYPPRIFTEEDCNQINIIGKLVEIKRNYK